jgi:hypothetical protein
MTWIQGSPEASVLQQDSGVSTFVRTKPGMPPDVGVLSLRTGSGRITVAAESRCVTAGSAASRRSWRTWAIRQQDSPWTARTTTVRTHRLTASGVRGRSSSATSGAGRTASRVFTACSMRRTSTSCRAVARPGAISACMTTMPGAEPGSYLSAAATCRREVPGRAGRYI